MDAELNMFLSQWLTITQAERRAIEAENWTELNRQQSLKQEMMPRLTAALERWRSGFVTPEQARGAQRARFQPTVDQLIQEENKNQVMLQNRRSSVKGELDKLDQSASQLRNVQKAYGTPAMTMWRSYS